MTSTPYGRYTPAPAAVKLIAQRFGCDENAARRSLFVAVSCGDIEVKPLSDSCVTTQRQSTRSGCFSDEELTWLYGDPGPAYEDVEVDPRDRQTGTIPAEWWRAERGRGAHLHDPDYLVVTEQLEAWAPALTSKTSKPSNNNPVGRPSIVDQEAIEQDAESVIAEYGSKIKKAAYLDAVRDRYRARTKVVLSTTTVRKYVGHIHDRHKKLAGENGGN